MFGRLGRGAQYARDNVEDQFQGKQNAASKGGPSHELEPIRGLGRSFQQKTLLAAKLPYFLGKRQKGIPPPWRIDLWHVIHVLGPRAVTQRQCAETYPQFGL